MSPSLRARTSLTATLLGTTALLGLAAPRAPAVSGAPYSGTGFDISYPQCSSYAGVDGGFGIVGVNDGRPFTENTCFDAEYAHARGGGRQVSFYMNLMAPIGKTGPVYTSSPRNCGTDELCQAQNYGWNVADYAYKAALPH